MKKQFNILWITVPVFIIFMSLFIGYNVKKTNEKVKIIDNNTDFSEFIVLPNYQDMTVSYTDIEMTEELLHDSLMIDLQMNGVSINVDDSSADFMIDDETIEKYFGMNADEYILNLKLRMENVRKWEEIYQYITDNTSFNYIPESVNSYYREVLVRCEEKAKSENTDLSSYLETNFGTTYNEFNDYIGSMYSEMLIFYALAQNENLEYSENDYEIKIKELLDRGMLYEEELEIFGKEYGYYQIIYADMEILLPDKIRTV